MKKILFVFLTISTLFSMETIAQSGFCGMSIEDQIVIKEKMLQNRADALNTVQVRTGIMWVPIQFHILEDNNGGNRVDVMNVLDMLCALNEDYLDQDIQFFMKDDFNFIKNSSVNNNPNIGGQNSNPFAQTVMTGAKVLNGINIFIVKDIPGGIGGQGQILGFYSPTFDWLVLKRSEVSANKVETLTHELGHFFTLPHPFLGWDSQPWDEDTHGNPAPVNSPGGVQTERMDGSNCNFAGDGICDTNPNYSLGFGWPNCDYTGPVQDPNGVLLAPQVQEENFMAYFIGCATEFTPDQKALISMDLNSPQRNYLNAGSVTPLSDAIATAPTTQSPINGANTPFYNVVELDWSGVAGATHYFVEVDRTSTFSFAPEGQLVTGTTAVFEDVFDENRTYYWRVKAYSAGNPCGPISSVESFKTGVTTGMVDLDEIVEVKEWKVSPNPIKSDQILNIQVVADLVFDANVKVFTTSGQLVQSQAHTFGAGTSHLELNIEGLSMGMYLLFIESESGVLNEKIVVTR